MGWRNPGFLLSIITMSCSKPFRELTYPLPFGTFEDDVPVLKVGYVDGKNPASTSWYVVNNPHYLRGFIHVRWCRVSSINSIAMSCKIFSVWCMVFRVVYIKARHSCPSPIATASLIGKNQGTNRLWDTYNTYIITTYTIHITYPCPCIYTVYK